MSITFANIDRIYKEDPLLKREDVAVLVDWLQTQPHLPQLTELQLVLFLHSCYYDTEAANTTIVNYYTLKQSSDLLKSADEDLIRNILTTSLITVLPKRTPEGYSIFLAKLLDHRSEVFDCVNSCKLLIMVINLYFHLNGPTNGFLILVDMDGATFGHLFKLSISALRQGLHYLQEAAFMRLKGLHYVNVAPVTSHAIALARPFMKKEVYELIKLHMDSIESLYEHIPKSCLPKDLGGSLPTYRELNEENIMHVINNLEFFKWHDGQNVEEGLKQGRRGGLFGTIQGFFGRK